MIIPTLANAIGHQNVKPNLDKQGKFLVQIGLLRAAELLVCHPSPTLQWVYNIYLFAIYVL